MVSDNKYFVWISYLLAVLAASLVGLFCIYAIAILDMKEAILGIDLIIDATIRDFVRDYFTYLPLMFLTLLVVAFPGFIIVRRIARQIFFRATFLQYEWCIICGFHLSFIDDIKHIYTFSSPHNCGRYNGSCWWHYIRLIARLFDKDI